MSEIDSILVDHHISELKYHSEWLLELVQSYNEFLTKSQDEDLQKVIWNVHKCLVPRIIK